MNCGEVVKILEYFRGTTSGSCASSFGVCCVFEVWPYWYSLLVIVFLMIGNDHNCSGHHDDGQQFFFLQATCGSVSLAENNTYFTSRFFVTAICHKSHEFTFWSEINFAPHPAAGSRLVQAAGLRSASAAPMFVSWGSILRHLLLIWWDADLFWCCGQHWWC